MICTQLFHSRSLSNLSCKSIFLALSLLMSFSTPAGAQQSAPAIDVNVIEVKAQAIQLWNEFSGRLRAVDVVEIKPRVGGYIHQVLFEDGAYVNKGDLVFVIDPRPYEIEIERIKGELESAKSRARLAEIELERSRELSEDKMVPVREVDNRENDKQVALAQIDVIKAELRRARLNLEYAHIKAPISGRISRAEFTEGNLIETMMGAPVLSTIVSTDKLYAEFDIDENSYLEMIWQNQRDLSMPVEMTLSGDQQQRFQGTMHSFDNQLNTDSGTIRARALFENQNEILVPGMFVVIRMGSQKQAQKILLSEKAIGTDQNKKFVYVVNEQNQVEYREVKLGRRIKGSRIIESGLQEGARVIINNIHLIRPGVAVNPTVTEPASQV